MILKFDEALQHLFPPEVEMQAATPLDALKLLAVQHPLAGKIDPVPVRIKQLTELDLTLDPTLAGERKIYDIVPADKILTPVSGYSGAGGNGGLMSIVIGVVLIAVAIFAPVLAGAVVASGTAGAVTVAGTSYAFAAGSFAAYAASAAVSIGVGMVLTGVMSLLAPNPKNKVEGNYSSRSFSSQTTTEIGTPIQLILGRHLASFHLFSFNVDSRNYDGIDEPDKSPYFKGKADEFMPTVNMDKFYGYLKAGDKVYLNQTDNNSYRTGREF